MTHTTARVWKAKSSRLIVNGESVSSASLDDVVEVILPKTGFYIEAGGQVGDEGYIRSPLALWERGEGEGWEIEITAVRRACGWNHHPYRTGHLWSTQSW